MCAVSERFDFIRGDATGLEIPAHPDALLAAGPDWLTLAFRQFGTLSPGNRVTAIHAKPCPGGSTGKKLFLTIETERPEPSLDAPLFVKFSRDFDDVRRDWQRTEMAGEARFVALSRQASFPIRVPRGIFADYHEATGTGLVITECIAYGENGIEPHRRKCLDWQTMADPLPYYRATTAALARLAGAHKSGALGEGIEPLFPFDPATGSADPFRYSPQELAVQLQQGRDLGKDCPRLIPAELRDPAFLSRLEDDVALVLGHEAALREYLTSNLALISLNHWNSHIDNAWFWPEGGTVLCGLIDWGRVSQLTFGAALWGGLSAAHHDIWDRHMDDLLAHFLGQYHAHGGPLVSLPELKCHLAVHMAVMGTARMFAAPEIIRFRMPGITSAASPRDPMFEPIEADPARNYLSCYVALLKHWQREDFGAKIRDIVG